MFNYQGSFCRSFQVTAFIFYQKLFSLSRTFLTFFKVFLLALLVLTSRLRYNTICSSQCQYFFQSFSFSFEPVLYHLWYHFVTLTYKNYWLSSSFPDDIKRRKRDLNPRAGHPTYTLSRGTSSASWVFLLTELYCISTVFIQLAPTVRGLLYKRFFFLSIPFYIFL